MFLPFRYLNPPDHGEHCKPHVGEGLGREPPVADTQHVGHRLEQGPGVLLPPVHLLTQMINQILTFILSIAITLQETA